MGVWMGRGGSPSIGDRRLFCTEHSAYEDSFVSTLLIVPFFHWFTLRAEILSALLPPFPLPLTRLTH